MKTRLEAALQLRQLAREQRDRASQKAAAELGSPQPAQPPEGEKKVDGPTRNRLRRQLGRQVQQLKEEKQRLDRASRLLREKTRPAGVSQTPKQRVRQMKKFVNQSKLQFIAL